MSRNGDKEGPPFISILSDIPVITHPSLSSRTLTLTVFTTTVMVARNYTTVQYSGIRHWTVTVSLCRLDVIDHSNPAETFQKKKGIVRRHNEHAVV